MKRKRHQRETELQRDYYARTAEQYDAAHVGVGEGHDLATTLLEGLIDHYGHRSLLDVGAGTGRTLRRLATSRPSLLLKGIEPVAALRRIGVQHGLSDDMLQEGDATDLPFADESFDVVSAFGVLHHVPEPAVVVAEMLRVARHAVFISDANRFAQGGCVMRRIKRWAWTLGLWPAMDMIRTRGRGYTVTHGDGVSYSYSVFDQAALLHDRCSTVHWIGLTGSGGDLLYGAAQIALHATKR